MCPPPSGARMDSRAPVLGKCRRAGGAMRPAILPGTTLLLAVCALCACAASNASTGASGGRHRERALTMLNAVSRDVTEHYYDAGYHGVDWPARVAKAKAD